MSEIRSQWAGAIASALNTIKNSKNIDGEKITAAEITAETPPNPAMGDIGFPMFQFAKMFRMGPPVIAAETVKLLQSDPSLAGFGTAKQEGPYVNVFLSRSHEASRILSEIMSEGDAYGKTGLLDGQRIMIEFSGPNTNKPLHLGHLRNDALGESISRIFDFCGAEVLKVNIINNRGVHICKSMLAYRKFGNGTTPEKEGIKSDHFVGAYYVKFHQYSKDNPEKAEQEVQEMLLAWEAGDPDVRELWQQMNDWAISGIVETYERTGISFEKFYYESDTYLKGKDEVLAGLEKGLFYRDDDGSVWVDLSPINLDKKVLLRKDGTSLYITQDIGTAIFRHKDWPFDRMVYVVANEQQYHFKVLFYVLRLLGFEWAENLYHLSYGMVNLPEGKMKSREGTIVDADDLIDNLRNGALEEIAAKGREEAVGDPEKVAEKIALGALHYYLLQVTPLKDMLFNPKESLSFNGNTGPYLQYMGARITSLLGKAGPEADGGTVNPGLLTHEAEWELLKVLADYSAQIERAAKNYDPSIIASYLYELSKCFSRFYHECPILAAGTPDLVCTRLELAKAVRIVLKSAMHLILVPFLEAM
ncbi:arginine--tRNA ligase [Brucepastera parasyntrophica]|uniref:arginine--tRNA ligase n=1 Tax=Brucepastera parasyntrophica TaxID=2880008 RepID=UPI00210C19D3|nr:arginine--tRNA ligase [Brucepastera parasyntrophica]ULQ60494.1 arginine--tRNA ligase [Brucepastera parasyntrophica]